MKKAKIWLAAVMAAAGLCAVSSRGADRKMIAFAWEFNHAGPQELLKLADDFDRTPLDGVGINLRVPVVLNGVSTNFNCRFFMHDPSWTRDAFRHLVPSFRELTQHRSMKECFLSSFRAPRTYIPWEDDAAWARIAGSMRTVAWLAKEGGLRGLYVDPEDYKRVRQFARHANEVPYDELCDLVRRRARETFGPVFEEYPAVRIHFFWLLSHLEHYAKADRADVVNMLRDDENLWPAFVNGILDVMTPEARLSDGDEDSYRYLSDNNSFSRGACIQRKQCLELVAPENREKYLRQVGYAPSIYLDMFINNEGATWYKAPVEGTRLERMRRDVIQATDVADDYIWFWGEKCSWVSHGPQWRKPDARITDATWEERIPGLGWMLEWAKDPVALYDRTVAQNSYVNLAEKNRVIVTNGYVTMAIPNVRGGEYYGIAYSATGASQCVNVSFRDAKGKYVKPTHNRIYARDGRGVVRVPEGGARGIIVFEARNRPGEQTLFDDIRVFRFREAPPESAREPEKADPHRDYWSKTGKLEQAAPTLEESVKGFDGRVLPLEYVTAKNAVGDATQKTLTLRGWKNERVHGQVVVWSEVAQGQIRCKASALTGPNGAKIPAGNVTTRFVRYVLAHATDGTILRRELKETIIGDCLETAETMKMEKNGFRPVWVTVAVPKDAESGTYCGTLSVKAESGDEVNFPIVLDVGTRALPDEKSFFLDLWQAPWAVARYHGVKPFSKAHYMMMKPLLQELAAAGQKTITTFLVSDLWHPGDGDKVEWMVERRKEHDGNWSFDYSRFDEYVEFAKRCGIGPQIHCYSPLRFQSYRPSNKLRNRQLSYMDAEGFERTVTFDDFHSSAYEEYLAALLISLEKHAKDKNWLGDVYIAVDEMDPELVDLFLRIIKKHAPGLKLAYASDRDSKKFMDFDIAVYSQALRGNFISKEFLDWTKQRSVQGQATTFYVCNIPARPNTWMTSSFAECQWMGIYAAANGLDGFLRWSCFNWGRDPFFDSHTVDRFEPGESYLLYPEGRASVRWEMLRDGIEDFEKIRILKKENAVTPALAEALREFDYAKAGKDTPEGCGNKVRAVRDELDGEPGR